MYSQDVYSQVVYSQDASDKLGVGVTTLKRICRASKVDRWPYRKRAALPGLVSRALSNIKAMKQEVMKVANGRSDSRQLGKKLTLKTLDEEGYLDMPIQVGGSHIST